MNIHLFICSALIGCSSGAQNDGESNSAAMSLIRREEGKQIAKEIQHVMVDTHGAIHPFVHKGLHPVSGEGDAAALFEETHGNILPEPSVAPVSAHMMLMEIGVNAPPPSFIYKLLSWGTCQSAGMLPVNSSRECQIASTTLQITYDGVITKPCSGNRQYLCGTWEARNFVHFNPEASNSCPDNGYPVRTTCDGWAQCVCKVPYYTTVTSGTCEAAGLVTVGPGIECDYAQAVLIARSSGSGTVGCSGICKPPKYQIVTSGRCQDQGLLPVDTADECGTAAVALKIPYPTVRAGCSGNRQYLCGTWLDTYLHFNANTGSCPDGYSVRTECAGDATCICKMASFDVQGAVPPTPPPPADQDGDGVPDNKDSDVDGDKIPDAADPDQDGDGIPNANDKRSRSFDPSPNADQDGDGKPNAVDTDIDGDGTPNSNDQDIDGDGTSNGKDTDGDGDGLGSDQDSDIDADGTPNKKDTDMDGDGTLNGQDRDVDGDGLAATDPDVDSDGQPNSNDADIDGDGTQNAADADADGDGVKSDHDPDSDGDGKLNGQDSDMDGDGTPNDIDSDSDGDQTPNVQDQLPGGNPVR